LFARPGRIAAVIGLSVSAVGLSGAIALPASAPATSPIAAPQQEPVQYLGIAADAGSGEAHEFAHPAELPAQRFTGRVGTNLTESMRAAGVPERQGREYVAVLSRAIDLAGGLSVDDRFDLVIMRGDDGTLGQLAYAGMDRVARADVELMKWTDGKQVIWVNGDGVGGETSSAMHMPVSGRVTSGFGSRFHPILGMTRFHKGVDLRATAGTPITAAADGRVVSAGWHGGYGRQVAIAHSGGIETTYGHMSRIAASAGEIVRQGQVIGYVGSSGLSTGPHLHFEVLKNGRPVNPVSAKLGGGPGHLQGEKLRAFQGELRGLLLLPGQG
jgi:murein DD-endopeptidase MepM/ murein hydrolase activator NlpD